MRTMRRVVGRYDYTPKERIKNKDNSSRYLQELVAQGYTEEINMAHYSYHRGLETVVVPFDAAEAPARFSKFFSDAMQLKEAGLLAPNDGSVDPKWCPNNSFYEFIPVFTSEVQRQNETQQQHTQKKKNGHTLSLFSDAARLYTTVYRVRNAPYSILRVAVVLSSVYL